jgi:hypothetical protein
MTLQQEVMDGLNIPSWDDSIHAVKRVLANALRRVDRTATITDTNYFNHSFVPDFVVTWPSEPGRTRDVFLRLDDSDNFIAGDIAYLGDTRPVLLGLAGLPVAAEPSASFDRQAAAKEASVMVTDAAAVEELGEPPATADFRHILPAAMLKGGRGWITETAAATLTSAASDFFTGARSHDTDPIAQAAPTLTEALDDRQSTRLVNLGRIVWEATGGDPAQFPVTTDLAGVDDSGLLFLLDEAPSDDPEFWRSIGRMVTLERLLGLGVSDPPNLAPFIRANADRLSARVLLVKGSQPRLDEATNKWAVHGGALTFLGRDFIAYMAPKRDDLAIAPDEGTRLSFASFGDRTGQEQIDTVTVVAADGKTVTIKSEDLFDPATDTVLASVGGIPGTTIESVGLIVSGTHLECDFLTRTATGRTNARFDIVSLLERGLPMLWPITDDGDVEEIRLLRATVHELLSQPSLFDTLNE